jgi:ABC-type glutathione transport system ATPase component
MLRQILNKLKGKHSKELDEAEYIRILQQGEEEDLKALLLSVGEKLPQDLNEKEPSFTIPETCEIIVECRDEADQKPIFDKLKIEGYKLRIFNIVKQWDQADSFRAQSVVGSYTLNDVKLEKHFRGSLSLEDFEWQVGIIVGRSGSGKTSVAKQLFPEAYIRGFEYTSKCVLDDFPQELKLPRLLKCFAVLVLLRLRIG